MKVINLRMYGYINVASLGLHKLSKYLSVLLLTYINERYYKRSEIFKKDGHSVQNQKPKRLILSVYGCSYFQKTK